MHNTDQTVDYIPAGKFPAKAVAVAALPGVLITLGVVIFLLFRAPPPKETTLRDDENARAAMQSLLPDCRVVWASLAGHVSSRDANGQLLGIDRGAAGEIERDGKKYSFWLTHHINARKYELRTNEVVPEGKYTEVELKYVDHEGQEKVVPGGSEITPELRDFLLAACRKLVAAAKKAGI